MGRGCREDVTGAGEGPGDARRTANGWRRWDPTLAVGSWRDSEGGHMTSDRATAGDVTEEIVDEAGRQLRRPRGRDRRAPVRRSCSRRPGAAAARAIYNGDDAELVALFARGDDLRMVIGGLYLAPFAGIMFLWFVAVHPRPDRRARGPLLRHRVLRQRHPVRRAAVRRRRDRDRAERGLPLPGPAAMPSAATIDLLRALGYTTTFAFENRAAGVFLFATATIGLKTGVFPRWFSVDQLPAGRRPADRRDVRGLGDPRAARVGGRRQRVHPARERRAGGLIGAMTLPTRRPP